MRPLRSTTATAALVGSALGQSNSTSPTSDGEITIHTVTVAQTPFAFDPQTIYAIPGDIITFQFWSGNHSVIRAEYGYPCIPYEDVVGQPGFYSGFQAYNDTILTWNLTINDTSPVFYYCGAPGSCIGHGMLGVINPDANVSLNTQIELASQADYMIEPGQPLPEDVRQSVSNLAASATTATVTVTASTPTPTMITTTSAAPAAATTSAAPAPTSSSPSLSHGAIAGIAVGAVAGAALLAALFFYFGRTKTMQDELNRLRGRPNGGDGVSSTAHQSWMTGEKHNSAVSQLPSYRPSQDMRQHEPMPHPSLRGYYADPRMKDSQSPPPGMEMGQQRSFSSDALGAPRSLQPPQEMSSFHEPAPRASGDVGTPYIDRSDVDGGLEGPRVF